MLEARVITCSIDPTDCSTLTLDCDRASGTASFTVAAKPNYEAKDRINIQGITCQVERIGPVLSHGSKGYKVECRILPEAAQEFISVNYPDLQDGTSYSLAEVVQAVASQAGVVVKVGVDDRQVKTYAYTGRYLNALEALAEDLCAELLQQDGVWIIVPRDYSAGDFTIPGESIQTVDQTTNFDAVDDVASLATALRDAMIDAAEIADKIEDLEDAIEELEEQLEALEDEVTSEQDDDISGLNQAVFLDSLDLEFGQVGKSPQPIDTSWLIEGGEWNTFTPNEGDARDPNNLAQTYYQVREILDSDGVPTGDYKGCVRLGFARIMKEVQEPSDASGLYFVRGTCENMTGGPVASTTLWKPITPEFRTEVIDEGGTSRVIRRMYFAFQIDKAMVDFLSIGYDTSKGQKDNRHYSLRLETSYIPVQTIPWQFTGQVDYSVWPVVNNSLCVGMVGPDKVFYNVNGDSVAELDSEDQVPGTIMDGNCLRDSSGGLVGICNASSISDLANKHIGIITGDKVRKTSTVGAIIGYLPGGHSPVTWPGFVTDYEAQAAIPAYLAEKMPTAAAVDYTGFDPDNPDSWQPSDADPNDEETRLLAELEELKKQLADAQLTAEVLAAKIACILRELATYAAEGIQSAAETAADAWTAHRRKEEELQEWNLVNDEALKVLFEAAVVADQALMAAVSSLELAVVTTNCTFIYDNTLPLPMSQLSVSELVANVYESDAGTVDSVSLNLTDKGCAVTVTATRRKES